MPKLAWLTPESTPAEFLCRRLLYPNSAEWSAIIDGLLLLLTDASNFEQVEASNLTPDEVAAVFDDLLDDNLREGNCMIVGELRVFAFDTVPDGWLRCDGFPRSKTNYPKLFDVIGYTYGGSGDTFNVPDLRDRVVAGTTDFSDGSQDIGHTAGQRARGINIENMPEHTHSQPWVAASPVQAGAGGVGVGYNPANQTGSAGNGVPMDIRQPTMYFLWCIYAGE